MVFTKLPSAGLQNLMDSSKLPDQRSLQSGENERDLTMLVWPSNVCAKMAFPRSSTSSYSAHEQIYIWVNHDSKYRGAIMLLSHWWCSLDAIFGRKSNAEEVWCNGGGISVVV